MPNKSGFPKTSACLALLLVAPLAHTQSAFTAFTAERWVYSYASSTQGALVFKEITAWDARGDRATVSSSLADPNTFLVRRVLRLNGDLFRISDSLGIVTGMKEKDEPSNESNYRAKLVANHCLPALNKMDRMPDEPILGKNAVVVQWQTPSARFRDWRVPELGCFAIQRVGERREPDGSFRIWSEYRPISVHIGEPEPSLLQVPTHLRQVPPFEFSRLMAAAGGGH